MPLIQKKVVEVKKTIAIRLEVELLAKLNAYATMLESPRDHVLSNMLHYVIDRDKDFAAYKAEKLNGAAAAKAGK